MCGCIVTKEKKPTKKNKVVAVLSTSVMPKDGTYSIHTISKNKVDLEGLPHYVGHPCTKKIIEDMGAVPAEGNTFHGLEVGEEAICVPIKHRKNKREHRFTKANQVVSLKDLCFRILKRIK